MRVKIGNVWHDADEMAICIQLTPQDQANIANMSPDCTMCAIFPFDCKMTNQQKLDWMDGRESYGK